MRRVGLLFLAAIAAVVAVLIFLERIPAIPPPAGVIMLPVIGWLIREARTDPVARKAAHAELERQHALLMKKVHVLRSEVEAELEAKRVNKID
jgi:hypothetical protein